MAQRALLSLARSPRRTQSPAQGEDDRNRRTSFAGRFSVPPRSLREFSLLNRSPRNGNAGIASASSARQYRHRDGIPNPKLTEQMPRSQHPFNSRRLVLEIASRSQRSHLGPCDRHFDFPIAGSRGRKSTDRCRAPQHRHSVSLPRCRETLRGRERSEASDRKPSYPAIAVRLAGSVRYADRTIVAETVRSGYRTDRTRGNDR